MVRNDAGAEDHAARRVAAHSRVHHPQGAGCEGAPRRLHLLVLHCGPAASGQYLSRHLFFPVRCGRHVFDGQLRVPLFHLHFTHPVFHVEHAYIAGGYEAQGADAAVSNREVRTLSER